MADGAAHGAEDEEVSKTESVPRPRGDEPTEIPLTTEDYWSVPRPRGDEPTEIPLTTEDYWSVPRPRGDEPTAIPLTTEDYWSVPRPRGDEPTAIPLTTEDYWRLTPSERNAVTRELDRRIRAGACFSGRNTQTRRVCCGVAKEAGT